MYIKSVSIGILIVFLGLIFTRCDRDIDSGGYALVIDWIQTDFIEKEICIHISPDFKSNMSLAGKKVRAVLVFPDGKKKRYRLGKIGSHDQITLPIRHIQTWQPNSPSLYFIHLSFHNNNGETIASASRRFGIRSLETRDGKFFVNNRPFYMRSYAGEGGCGSDDLTIEQIRKRLTQAKRYGFNAVRHHSHIPTDEYMTIADEVGIFVQMEIGGKKIGDNVVSNSFQEWRSRWIDMIEMGRRHPSTFIYSCGNEMYRNDPGLIQVLDSLYDLAKAMDPSTLVLNRSGSNPYNDDYGKYDLIERPIGEYEHVAEFAREAFNVYLRGNRKGRSDEFPIVAHEYPLVASYPNPALISKYDSIPAWIDTTMKNARKHRLDHLLPLYVGNTEMIQVLCRKELLEEARKFSELDGYSMLRFTDCGNYVSGVVDDFADPKNISAAEFLQTNGETVLLCTWQERSFEFGDTLKALLQLSHHGTNTFRKPRCRWQLHCGTALIAEGQFRNISVGAVDVSTIGELTVPIPMLTGAVKLTLSAVIPGTMPLIQNRWSFWAFPGYSISDTIQNSTVIWDPQQRFEIYHDTYPEFRYFTDTIWTSDNSDACVILTDSWQESFYEFLDRGGRIFFLSDKTWPWPEEMGIFGLHITRIVPEQQSPPVFPQLDEKLTNWLTICSNHPKRFGNSGTIVNSHPALKNFPHDGFCDLHFWPMIYRAKSLRLADFPDGTKPIIRTIDNYYRGRSKGYIAELQVGKGKILICTLNLTQSFDWSAATRYMFKELVMYVYGNEFQPEVSMGIGNLRTMLDKYACEIKAEPLPVHNEMAARYETLWERRFTPGDIIVLYPYDAKGIDRNRLDVHYEYAQTQWYYQAEAREKLWWDFEIEKPGRYDFSIYLAGLSSEYRVNVAVDEKNRKDISLENCVGWNDFIQQSFTVEHLESGEHTLTLGIPENVTLQLRDIWIKEN